MKRYYVLIVTNGTEKKKAISYLEKEQLAYSLTDAWLQVTDDTFARTISMVCTEKQFKKLSDKVNGTRLF